MKLYFFCLLLVVLFLFSCKNEKEISTSSNISYKCSPCNLSCDTIIFDKPGICPHCKMKLIPNSQKISFELLNEYEGTFEYLDQTTLDFIVSPIDTILYAVIDKAMYPMTYISKDVFSNIQDEVIYFRRNTIDQLISYEDKDKVFKLITRDFKRMDMIPRKELFQHSDRYIYQKPTMENDDLEIGDLKDVFKNPMPIIDMIKETIDGHYPNIHSILIYKNGKLVLEEYFYGFNKDTPHQLRSASKSFVGNLMGIAIDKRYIASESKKVLPYFEDKYKSIGYSDELKENISIDHILKYQHGMDCENNNPKSKGSEGRMMESKDWTKYTLDLPMVYEPGSVTSYCTGCELIICDLIEMVTNQTIESFAFENLFKPLGITNYKWTYAANQTSKNNFSQMYITPRDLVKLAILNKDGGVWKGKQIVNEQWTNKLKDIPIGEYEYFWKGKEYDLDGKKYKAVVAQGNGGQKVHIWPELDMITVFTGGNYNYTQIYGKSTPPNEMITKYILRSME